MSDSTTPAAAAELAPKSSLAETAEKVSGPLQQRFWAWWDGYWYEQMPMERLRVFSRSIYLCLIFVVVFVDDWVPDHGWAPRLFWQPIGIARLLNIPAPTETSMAVLRTVLLVSCVASVLLVTPRDSTVRRRLARGSNAVVFFSHALWLIWAFSWSKVDHDRLTMMVMLGVMTAIPAVGTGPDRRVGWALRTIQVVFLLAYPLSAVSKFRKSGIMWASQATFARAIIRRGTDMGKWFLNHGTLLKVGQWAFITFEVAAIAALSRNVRVRVVVLVGIFFLHFFTWLIIGIHFLPHSIALLAFLPLERLTRHHDVASEGVAHG